MNRRTIDLLIGLVSGAAGLAVALYTAVIATEKPTEDADSKEENAAETP